MENTRHTTRSKDGTEIVYDLSGEGPALILVDGAFGSRSFGPMPKLAERLSRRFSVVNFDRRGRGESGERSSYGVAREIEDIDALVEASGGSACLYGFSSGGILAFRAAGRLLAKIRRLALYEPPLAAPDGRSPLPNDYRPGIERLIAAGRREEAVELFFSKAVGMPEGELEAMRATLAWPKYVGAAHTLLYDLALQEDSGPGRPLPPAFTAPIISAQMPLLMLHGDRSPAWLGRATEAIAHAIPGSHLRILAGQTHDVRPGTLAPVLTEFFAS